MNAPRSSQPSEHLNVFRRLREAFGDGQSRRRVARTGLGVGSEPFTPGRDPGAIGRAVTDLLAERGWSEDLARSELFVGWADAVGPSIADHAQPVSLNEGTLTVQCDSTAWATQLKLLQSQVLTTLAERFPEAGVVAMRFLGPDVPTFKHGRRSVPGRGPRDTYG